ncbi:peptidase M23-like protein [Alkalispirillum mobile]|uniref:Peptidase M23-like protein n=1 Tax=Alkalispirillum mobile TaxID=85925 RepID=A0A498CCZ4_9GAMM|nr:M23 family metallopeptidase [Alkalispirillum mobile]RLK51130.1 peptidase M23-like protein [Alkalispirillum mobile]
MRDRFTLTITDYRGSRHYSLHQLVKRVAMGVVGAVALAFLVGTALIWWLNHNLAELAERRDHVQREYEHLQEHKTRVVQAIERRNSELSRVIDEQSAELNQLDLELGHIEAMVGLRPEPEQERSQRLDVASQTALERALMLQQLPSGHPVDGDSRLTSGYGWRKHPVTGERSFHGAADYAADRGTEVVATADGVVNYAARHNSGLGKLVIVDHNFSFKTYYAHLHEIQVQQGEFVREGTVIGTVGSTGQATGPHLHYEVWHLQRKLNPEPFVAWDIDNYEALFEEEGRVQWDSLAKGIKRNLSLQEQQLSLRAPSSPEN